MDNNLQIEKLRDYYEFSLQMWKLFYDLYGCKNIIVIRYLKQDGILPSIYKDIQGNYENDQNKSSQHSLLSLSTDGRKRRIPRVSDST